MVRLGDTMDDAFAEVKKNFREAKPVLDRAAKDVEAYAYAIETVQGKYLGSNPRLANQTADDLHTHVKALKTTLSILEETEKMLRRMK